MKLVFYPAILFLCSLGCKQHSSESNMEYIEPEITDFSLLNRIVIPVDTLPSRFKYTTVVSNIYIGLDKQENALFFFDLENESFLKKIQKTLSGPEAFRISDFSYVTKDSIFLVSDEQNLISLINGNGDEYFRKNLTQSIYNSDIGWIESAHAKRIQYSKKESSLILPVYPDLAYTDSKFYDYGFLCKYNIESETLGEMWGTYPDGYGSDDKSYYPLGMNFSYSLENQHMLSFFNDHKIYLFDSTFQGISSICEWRSNFLPEKFLRLSVNHDFQEDVNYVNTEGFYFASKYDSNDSVLYRLVKHGQELKNKDGKLKRYNQSKWSVIYGKPLNPSFPVREVAFDSEKYLFIDWHLIGKNTILVSLENEFNEENEENLLEFQIIKLGD